MTLVDQPRLRPVESFPVEQPDGETLFALRDPDNFAGSVVLPYAAAVVCSLMDGTRSLSEIQSEFAHKFGEPLALDDLERLIAQLDERYFLDSDRFRARWKAEITHYLNSPVRPAAHAGGAYSEDPQQLREELADTFTAGGPGLPAEEPRPANARLCGVLSPHIDFRRGGSTFAWAYKKLVEESDADLFVIFGTAHNPMRNLFSVSRKDIETPLGIVETDRKFAARLSGILARTPGGAELNLAADELAHRSEHSIEFQAVFLQYLLGGRRPFKIVPVLTGSFHELVSLGSSPAESPQVAAFVAAIRKAVAEHPGKVCFISSGDLAHLGRRFGDAQLLSQARLEEQSVDDLKLLDAACRADAEAFYRHVAGQRDCNRICGLSPTYTLLVAAQPGRGEFLKYSQAVEPDGTSCVSFASIAFYE